MVLNPHSEYCCCCDVQAAAQRSQRKMTISCWSQKSLKVGFNCSARVSGKDLQIWNIYFRCLTSNDVYTVTISVSETYFHIVEAHSQWWHRKEWYKTTSSRPFAKNGWIEFVFMLRLWTPLLKQFLEVSNALQSHRRTRQGASAPLLKNLRASASCSKMLSDKKYIFSTVISGQTLFFRASASCPKTLNVKRIFNTVNISGQTLFSGQAQVAQTS